ncbi:MULTISPECIES: alpha/beta hydrolase [unclassified Streptomyces]|uniref:alpha/beta hydrolase n=1 Tax=unclassified Streptomyces TaxID=2593676 RepID=UPI003811CBAC
MSATHPTVVLVHGAFADASGFAGMIGELGAAGVEVVAPPNPLRGLTSDAAAVRAVVRSVEGPVVLVGHSYGGAVITEASAGLDNVSALVYLAAFGIDAGESCASVQAPFPASLLASTVRPTAYDAPGAVDGPDLYIAADRFRETFCADVPAGDAAVLCATQRPLAAAAFAENATGAGWRTVPAWYQLALHDRAIAPEAQRFMAERMGATIEEVDGSHAAFVAQPVRAARFVRSALDKT